MRSQTTILILFILSLFQAAGGCVKNGDSLGTHSEIFWPEPPEAKRIVLINAVSKPEDLNIRPGILKKFFNYIMGGAEASTVSPHGLSTDSQGRLYVVDTFLKRVHVFDVRRNQYYTFPSDSKKLVSPIGIAVDGRGLIYITDSKLKMVYIFKNQGKKFVAAFGRGIFERPTGIAVNSKTSELLVVDTLQSRVFRFDLSSLALKDSFGGKGRGIGLFHYPTHISVTATGNILISDSLNFRVQVFSPKGRFFAKIGGMGNSPGSFSRPKGVASDSDGNIYVVDGLFDNIQVFDKDGRLLMAFGEHGNGPGAFWLPTGIYIDPNDTIYVSDSSNQRIQVFQFLKKYNVVKR